MKENRIKSVLFSDMAGMSYIEGENPKGHQLPVNLIATRKFHIVRCGREEAIAKPWPYGQKPDIKAHAADKLTRNGKVRNGNRNPYA